MINGKDSELKLADGYAVISRRWKSGDRIDIEFPMPVRKVIADERVTEDKDKIAFQRGPVIFCAEWPEINDGDVLDLIIKKDASVTSEFEPSLLEGTEVIKTTGIRSGKTPDGKAVIAIDEPVKLIPYAFWNNRGPGQMRVWFPLSMPSDSVVNTK